MGARWEKEVKSLLFLKKKKQKDFHSFAPSQTVKPGATRKSYLVHFFKKEPLASFRTTPRSHQDHSA
jgi:hypothetical protein